jgi:hypothetical protein
MQGISWLAETRLAYQERIGFIYYRQHNEQLVIMFYNDMFRLTRVIVRLRSEPFGFSDIIPV